MAEYAFEIGDIVIAKVGVEQCKDGVKMGELRMPTSYLVTGRRTDECPGGAQRYYAIFLTSETRWCHEIELMHKSEFDFVAHVNSWLDADTRIRDRRNAKLSEAP